VALGVVTKMLRRSDGRMVEFGISPQADRLFRRYAAWIGRCARESVGSRVGKGQGRKHMFKLVTMSRTEKVCGTCNLWEGAREIAGDACQFVEDSEGVCRHLADGGGKFVDTLTFSTHRPSCGSWKPCGPGGA